MANMTQNQPTAGPPLNVLHDQNPPNTLGGIGAPTTRSRLRIPRGAFVVVVVVVVILLVILVGH